MDPGIIKVICFIGFFILLDLIIKVIKFLFPYIAAYGILNKANKKHEERLSKEWQKREQKRMEEFEKSFKITPEDEKPNWNQ